MEEKFVSIMKRNVKRDSMYSWSRSIVDKKDENPFWNGQMENEFIKDVHDGKVFKGKYKDLGIVPQKLKHPHYKTMEHSMNNIKDLETYI